jgi:hypothetical protein
MTFSHRMLIVGIVVAAAVIAVFLLIPTHFGFG